MYTEKEEMFLGCSCPNPKCKKAFDFVPITMKSCPFCKNPIDPAAVWHTRKYENTLILPGWVRAFGWPFLLILAGIFALLYPIYAYHYVEIKLPGLLISLGLVFFFLKLSTNGEH